MFSFCSAVKNCHPHCQNEKKKKNPYKYLFVNLNNDRRLASFCLCIYLVFEQERKTKGKEMDEYLYLKLLTLYRNLQLTRKWILHASDKTGHNLKIQITFEMNISMLKKI